MRPLLAAGAALTLAACAGASSRAPVDSGIPRALAEKPGFSTLRSLLDTTGLSGELAEGGPYTLFAPTDEAFAALGAGAPGAPLDRADEDRLRAILRHHVVRGRLSASALSERSEVETLHGPNLHIETVSGRLRVGNAMVVPAAGAIEADNGVVHTIDAVLTPPPAPTRSSETTGKKQGPDDWWW